MVGKMNKMPVTCGQGLPKLDEASEKRGHILHQITFQLVIKGDY